MKHALVWIFILVLGFAMPANAQTDVTAPVKQMLQNEGYKISEVRRTWLGRILIVAKKGPVLREVVLNRRSGAILNDQLFRGESAAPMGNSNPFGMGNPAPDNGIGAGPGPSGGPGSGGSGGGSGPGGAGPGGF